MGVREQSPRKRGSGGSPEAERFFRMWGLSCFDFFIHKRSDGHQRHVEGLRLHYPFLLNFWTGCIVDLGLFRILVYGGLYHTVN